MTLIQLTIEQARQLAIAAQMLTDERPTDLVDMIGQLWAVQLDPTAAIAPSADLVSWSRIGDGYRPDQLVAGLEHDRTLFEHRGFVRSMADLDLYRPLMASWPDDPGWSSRVIAWMHANSGFQRYLLTELENHGPLLSRDLDDRAAVPWPSTGWTNNRNVTQMLEFLAAQGKVAISGRAGRQRLFDISHRVYPPAGEAIDPVEAARERNRRLLRSLGIARTKIVGDAGSAARVDGVKGEWRIDARLLELSAEHAFAGRIALLSPFDGLVHDRGRLLDLFEFEYHLEMYTPPAKRVWGYYALPVLFEDRFVGAVDAQVDRKQSNLAVQAIRLDTGNGIEELQEIEDEVSELARWLGVSSVTGP